jgi:predicted transcriptional regulator
MTAKERLREWLDGLDEEDAEEALDILVFERPLRQALTPEERASIEKGLAELDRGEGIPHDEVFRRLGISR